MNTAIYGGVFHIYKPQGKEVLPMIVVLSRCQCTAFFYCKNLKQKLN